MYLSFLRIFKRFVCHLPRWVHLSRVLRQPHLSFVIQMFLRRHRENIWFVFMALTDLVLSTGTNGTLTGINGYLIQISISCSWQRGDSTSFWYRAQTLWDANTYIICLTAPYRLTDAATGQKQIPVWEHTLSLFPVSAKVVLVPT